MKTGKASIHTEMPKPDINTVTRTLTDLFRTIWTNYTIPLDWTKGLSCLRKVTSKTVTFGVG